MSSETKPRPCPFCGGSKFEIFGGEDSEIYIRCMNDGCSAFMHCGDSNAFGEDDTDDMGMSQDDRLQAQASWDTRPAWDALVTALKDARAAALQGLPASAVAINEALTLAGVQ